MKNMRKLLAVLLTFVMAFSLCSVAMAEEGALVASDDLRTTTYTDARGLTVPVKPTGIAVTVTPAGGTSENATFYKDVYQTSNTYNLSTATYIRAMTDAADTTEYGLKNATLTVTVPNNSTVVSITGKTFSGTGTTTRTTTLDLFNTAYVINIDNTNYTLAAGIDTSSTNQIGISSSDSWRLYDVKLGGNTANSPVYGSVVQNNYAGNADAGNNPWTNINYYIGGIYSLASGDTNHSVTFTHSGASIVSTEGDCVNTDGKLDLSGSAPWFNVSSNSAIRKYYVNATYNTSTSFVVSASTYAIDFTELENDPVYGSTFTGTIAEIESALAAYYATAPVFSTSASVMDVMLDFIAYAEDEGLFSDTTSCSATYLSSLDGLGEFDAGPMSGWCYMDGAYTPTCEVPMVGAADYPLGNAALFTWFLTTDYMPHF
jgi:hypothetical protein